MYAMGALGPAVGFLLGAAFLTIFVHPFDSPEGVSHSDDDWVGCWWAGLLIAGALSLAVTVLMGQFPHHLPNVKKPVVAVLPDSEPTFAGFGNSIKGKRTF